MRRHGFSERRETAVNQGRQYYEYKHPDKSKGYRYNPDGTIRDRPAGHDTGERVVIP